MSTIEINKLDIQDIKEKIIGYISNSATFKGYNFQGSALNIICDILSIDSYFNAFYTNMLMNEAFLDSSLKKSSILSHAKTLGYLATSARGAVADIKVSLSLNTNPEFILLPAYTRFQTSLSNSNYVFMTMEDYILTPNSGIYSANISIREGVRTTQTFDVSYYDQLLTVVLNNKNIDIETITVAVKENESAIERESWSRIENILTTTSNTKGYFIQQNFDEYIELQFGNDIIGKKLNIGNIVEVSYNVTHGNDCNQLSLFTVSDRISNTSIINITTLNKSVGGSYSETANSIKFNAPKAYTIQNRTVTSFDFQHILKQNFSEIETVNVWGGEENEIPMYARTIISIKPYGGYALSNKRKEEIVSFLRTMQMMGPDPILIDPSPIYITPYLNIKYDKNLSNTSAQGLVTVIRNSIDQFMLDYVGNFGDTFFASKFSTHIDNCNPSIRSNELALDITKIFFPVLNSAVTYAINFQQPLAHPYEGFMGCLNSSGFNISGNPKKIYLDDDGLGKVRSYYIDNQSNKVYVNSNQGVINYTSGLVVLNKFSPVLADNNFVSITTIPKSKNITSTRNGILMILGAEIQIWDYTKNIILSRTEPVFSNVPLMERMIYSNILV